MYAKKSKINIKKFIVLFCFVLILVLLCDGKDVSRYTYDGMIFSVKFIISSVFPFIFLSNVLIDTLFIENAAEKLSPIMLKLKINPYILPPFFISLFCGFPVGAIYICDLYKKRLLTKKEADLLLPMCNNPSPAFVISTVGAGFLNSQRKGLLLWVANIIFSCFITLIFLPRHTKIPSNKTMSNDSYCFSSSFVKCIKKAVFSSLSICGTVTVFYSVSKLLIALFDKYGISKGIAALCVSILEIGNGCMYSTAMPSFSATISAFAVGFGGICVMFQVKAAGHGNSSMFFYLISKTVCALLCAFFAFFLL